MHQLEDAMVEVWKRNKPACSPVLEIKRDCPGKTRFGMMSGHPVFERDDGVLEQLGASYPYSGEGDRPSPLDTSSWGRR
jgi:hypothetical protein